MSALPRVAIVGLGVMGGSLALRLIERGIETSGFAADPADSEGARSIGVHVASTIALAVSDATIVVLAVPLDVLADVATVAIGAASPGALIMHLCSLQRADAARLDATAQARVIGTHPLAGTHGTGFRAASAELFGGATIYADAQAASEMRPRIDLFWRTVGAARVEYMDPDEHDRLMAKVSHLPQLVATSLASVLARSGVTLDQLGPGAQGVTRLAGSSLAIWWPLLDRAPTETAELLGEAQRALGELQEACASRDRERLASIWNAARQWRMGADA